MASIAQETRDGVNKFIERHAAAPGECTFALVQFDNEVEIFADPNLIGKTLPLNEGSYEPRGMTALYDAVALTVLNTGDYLAHLPAAGRPSKVIFVIVTDGQENSSQHYGGPLGLKKVSEMIKHQTENYKWEFVFIGANQDAFANGAKLGVSQKSTISYSATKAGTSHLYASLSDNSLKMRSGAKADMAWEKGDRDAQAAAGGHSPT